MTQTDPNLEQFPMLHNGTGAGSGDTTHWYPGWGFDFDSPDGNVNNATRIRHPDGTITPVNNSTTPATGTSDADKSARAILDATLSQFGLQALGETVWQWYLNGKTVEQIMLDIRQTPEYVARFPAMDTLSKAGHAISEAEYINYEVSATQMMRAAGLPSGFYDNPDDFTKLLTREVGLPELQTRIDLNKQAAFDAPQEVKDELARLYGVSQGGLTAFFIDPDRALPLLQRDWVAAQTSGAAVRTGYGQLSQAEAERLAALGVSPEQAQAGFSQLGYEHELFSQLPGEGSGGISRTSQLAAQFGQNADALDEIKRKQAERVAAFQGDAAFAAGQTGQSGLGNAK